MAQNVEEDKDAWTENVWEAMLKPPNPVFPERSNNPNPNPVNKTMCSWGCKVQIVLVMQWTLIKFKKKKQDVNKQIQ